MQRLFSNVAAITNASERKACQQDMQFCVLLTYNVEFGHSYKTPKYCICSTIIIPLEMLWDLCKGRRPGSLKEEIHGGIKQEI